ncbi:MAG: metal-dependent transcriptional regulator [Clostridia bacterium]|jgi:DtxR family Mn-dependent transcriptional regulator|nr:winged helix DNA-binding protein [Clostridiaceae bacterium]
MGKKEFYTVRGYQLLLQNKKSLSSAMEDYLEMIFRTGKQEGIVRIGRLAELLNVKASSATKMVQKLGELGLVRYERYGFIELTEDGKNVGEYLLYRHNVIEGFLKLIGIKENLLVETELIEHNISPETLKKMKILTDFLDGMQEIKESFERFKKEREEE